MAEQEANKLLNNQKQSSIIAQKYLQDEEQLPNRLIASHEYIEEHQEKPFGEKYLSCVGMIQSIWFDSHSTLKKPIKCLHGTAFLINSTTIVTCTHNIYEPQKKSLADEVKFIPGHNGYITSSVKIYTCTKFEFLPIEREDCLDLWPSVNDLCIGRLQKPVGLKEYIPMQLYHPPECSSLTLIAYPNKEYRGNSRNLLSVCLDRRHSVGKMAAIRKNIISYHISTEQGCSGGTILAMNQTKIYLVGMHSHKGNITTNQGLFFNSKTWTILKFLINQMQDKIHQNLNNNIHYNLSNITEPKIDISPESRQFDETSYNQDIELFDQYFTFLLITGFK